ncbi:MAG: Asp-tRNA(Asn)/Glu-tRNA(Gln) amidotransferase subunit GatB [Thiohalospira sp.]
MDFTIRIGLEVHIQLNTTTKLFSPEPYVFGQEPNYYIDPVTVGLPGTLPSINQKALDLAITLALATNCEINRQIFFDRKNYFYPDLPKGFQITQKSKPLGINGELAFMNHKNQIQKIGITQVHIEEDSAKSNYNMNQRFIDYNRAGVPLMEVVTSPELSSPDEAAAFLEYLRILVKETDINNGKMEEGAIRCDANISVTNFNTKKQHNEIKNLNSVNELKTALKLEIQRQKKEFLSNTFKRGYTLSFTSRLKRNLFSREKEKPSDYAYITEPDILPLIISEESIKRLENNLHELPAERFQRALAQYGLKNEQAWTICVNRDLFAFFEALNPEISNKQELIHFLLGPFKSLKNTETEIYFHHQWLKANLVSLINMITEREITRETAYQNIWPKLLNSENKTTFDIAKENDWLISNNDAKLLEIIKKIILDYPEEINKYRKGKLKIVGFFMGQIMKKTKNRFLPQKVKMLLLEELNKYK